MNIGTPNKLNVIYQNEVKAEKLLPVPPLNLKHRPPMHSGHRFYECNHETKTIQEVTYVVKAAYFKSTKNDVMYIHRPNCHYLTALNEDNALKKFIKFMAKKRGLKIKDTTKNGKSNTVA